jgi:RIO-like serine/threonine protein kinase
VPPRFGDPARAFDRADLERGPREILSQGRWANAVLYRFEHQGCVWVVKDFGPRSWLVRTLIGRFLVRREHGALRRLAGVPATPQGAFRVDAHALAYHFVPGRAVRSRGKPGALPAEFFPQLERSLKAMHRAASIVHLDLRNAENILVTEGGEPLLLDFQSAVSSRWMPRPLRRFAETIDLAAIYKHWKKRSPATMGPERERTLARITRIRPLWALRGYIGSSRRDDGQR